MAFAGPGREDQQNARARPRRQGVAFGGLEPEKRAGADHGRLSARGHLHHALKDAHPRVLLYLVFAELLPRLEHDENRARAFILVHDNRVTRPLWRIDLKQVPLLHAANSIRYREQRATPTRQIAATGPANRQAPDRPAVERRTLSLSLGEREMPEQPQTDRPPGVTRNSPGRPKGTRPRTSIDVRK